MFSPFLSLVPLLLLLITLDITIPITATSSETSFVYGGCSRTKYLPGSQYESYVNSALTTLVNSAMYTPYYNFTTESTPNSPVSALYQCRGDLSQSSCSNCVQRALSQLGVICVSSCGGALQLEGCFVKYDNATFVGVEDKTVVVRKCGSSSSSSSPDELGRREQVLNYLLMSGRNEFYRVGESGDVRGVAQCVGDLSLNQCRDCLGYAVQQLKSVCVQVSWGDVYLGKCYVRISNGGSDSDGSNGSSQDDEIEKTLSILVGLIAGVALLIIFFAFIRKLCDGKDGK